MSLMERIKKLEEKVKSLWIVDSEDILAEDTGMGIALHLEDPFIDSGSGDTYNGYFKVIQTAPNKIKIVDGKDEKAASCGKVQVNNLASQDLAVKELTFTGNAFVYRQALAVMNTATPPVMTSATVTFEQFTAFPEWQAGKEKELVCRIEYTAPVAPATIGTIKIFPGTPLSSRINIIGDC